MGARTPRPHRATVSAPLPAKFSRGPGFPRLSMRESRGFAIFAGPPGIFPVGPGRLFLKPDRAARDDKMLTAAHTRIGLRDILPVPSR